MDLGPYDVSFKSLVDSDPAAQIHLFSGIPWDRPIRASPVERELTLPQMRVDASYLVEDEVPWVAQYEEDASPDSDGLEEIAWRAHALHAKYRRFVETQIVLIRRERPSWAFESGLDRGGRSLTWQFRPKVCRTWTVPASQIFEHNVTRALSWVPAFKSTTDEVMEAHRLIEAVPDPGLRNTMRAEFRTMLGLRYTIEEIRHLFGEESMIIGPETARHSALVKPLLAEVAHAAGVEGSVRGSRRFLASILARRFPGALFPSLDRIASVEELEAIGCMAFTATADEIADAIQRAERNR